MSVPTLSLKAFTEGAPAEREAHAAFVARMGGKALWLRDVPAN